MPDETLVETAPAAAAPEAPAATTAPAAPETPATPAAVPETPTPGETTPSVDDYKKMVEALRRESAGHRARATDVANKLKVFEDAQLTEAQRVEKERDEAKEEARLAREEAKAARVEVLAARHGIVSPEAAVKLLEVQDGQTLDEAFEALVTKYPFLKAPAPAAAPAAPAPAVVETPAVPAAPPAPVVPPAPATSPTNPARQDAAPTVFSTDQISDFTFYKANEEAEILKAVREGRIVS